MSTKYKPRAYGEESTTPVVKRIRDEAALAAVNRKAYRQAKLEKKACAFGGCMTRVRYRSVYAPYCDRHGTTERRERA